MHIAVLPECSFCTTYMPGAHKGQKKAYDSLELEFWRAVSHCMGDSN